MPGLVPGIHVFNLRGIKKGVDGRDKPGHDEGEPVGPLAGHTGNAIEYFTWLSAKLDSIEAMPSSRVSLFFRNAS
jgi:hypothetical protein